MRAFFNLIPRTSRHSERDPYILKRHNTGETQQVLCCVDTVHWVLRLFLFNCNEGNSWMFSVFYFNIVTTHGLVYWLQYISFHQVKKKKKSAFMANIFPVIQLSYPWKSYCECLFCFCVRVSCIKNCYKRRITKTTSTNTV